MMNVNSDNCKVYVYDMMTYLKTFSSVNSSALLDLDIKYNAIKNAKVVRTSDEDVY